jgi:transcription elongation GreA/GreB family factor
MNPPELKTAVHRHCLELVSSRIAELERALAELAESVANETKSTAGDKYETARAMLHIEQAQLGRQLSEQNEQLSVLRLIDPARLLQRVVAGSLIEMEGGWYYLSTALGKMNVDSVQVIALSLKSPLGAKLSGLCAGDKLVLNGQARLVTAVY